ncbi:MAG: rhomboid family intramembrane serine protease [Elusimicrobiota bacterium]|jgi:membrane associated rhomboid family serine protease
MSRSLEHAPLDFGRMSSTLKALIVANLVIYGLGLLVGGDFTRLFGLVPAKVVEGRWVWQPFTYLFLHGGFVHLLFNLLALWMFGISVEAAWGPREFLRYYFICGVGAGLVNIAVAPHSLVPIIGASGAIYGLLVAFAMLYPEAVVYLYGFFPVKAKHMAILFGLVEFFAGAADFTPGVARLAHLAGMVIGFVYIRWWWIMKIRAKALVGDLMPRGPVPVERAARPAPRKPRRAPLMVRTQEEEMAEVDRILDKILEHGESALTDDERATLRRHKPGGDA